MSLKPKPILPGISRRSRGTFTVKITRSLPEGVKTFSKSGLPTLAHAKRALDGLRLLYPAQKTGPKPRRQ